MPETTMTQTFSISACQILKPNLKPNCSFQPNPEVYVNQIRRHHLKLQTYPIYYSNYGMTTERLYFLQHAFLLNIMFLNFLCPLQYSTEHVTICPSINGHMDIMAIYVFFSQKCCFECLCLCLFVNMCVSGVYTQECNFCFVKTKDNIILSQII